MCKKVKMSCIVMCVGLDLHTDSDSPHLALEWVFFSGSIHLSALVSKTSPLSVKAAHRRDPGTEFYSTRPGEWHQTLTHTHTKTVSHTLPIQQSKTIKTIKGSSVPKDLLSHHIPLSLTLYALRRPTGHQTQRAPQKRSQTKLRQIRFTISYLEHIPHTLTI